MRTVCEQCGMLYDDLDRLRVCPHAKFEMRVFVYRGDGAERVCTSIEELHAFMEGKL